MICPAPAEPICYVNQVPVAGSMPAWAPLSIPWQRDNRPARLSTDGYGPGAPRIAPPRTSRGAAPLGSMPRGAVAHGLKA